MKKTFTCGFAVALAVAGVAGSARADIVLLTNGRTLKVKSYVVDDGIVKMSLPSGGDVRLPILEIERIVDDEVEDTPDAPVVIVAVVPDTVFPKRSWRFTDESRPLFGSKFDKTILEASRKFDVDAALVSAVIKAESDFDPATVSNKGAQGLMQLMPATALRFGVTNSFDPVANIYAGTKYLRWLLETFNGNADLAVAAYNAGEGNVWKYNGIPPFHETVTYVQRIAKHFLPAAASATSAVASR